MRINVDLTKEDLFEAARHLTQEEAIEFISAIDDAFADYDFTVALRDHFSAIIDKCDEEISILDSGGSE